MRAVGWIVLALLTIPLVAAQPLAEPRPFALRDGPFDITSGQTDADIAGPGGATAFYDVTDFEITGIDRACTRSGCSTGELRIVADDGESLLMEAGRFHLTYSADHALSTFVDLTHEPDIPRGGPSVLMAGVNTGVSWSGPQYEMPFTPTVAARLYEGERYIKSIDDGGIILTGDLHSDFQSRVVVVPFDVGSQIIVGEADPAAAQEGLSPEQLEEIQANVDGFDFLTGLHAALEGSLAAFQNIIGDVFNAAAVQAGTEIAPSVDDLRLERFETLTVSASAAETWWAGDLLFAEGKPAPAYAAGVEAPNPAGWFLIAIAGLAAMFGLATGRMPKPDRRRLARSATSIAICSALAGAFMLWDAQLAASVGTSAMTANGEEALVATIWAGQLLLFLVAVGIAAVPMGIAGSRMTKGKSAMRPLVGGLAVLAGYFIALLYLHHVVGWVIGMA